ncbi:hypothetical protein CVS40_0026 [Lucilia cuprina]|nr:hypothetical protein CVS40_0026 [Lucilia cuprina]
MQEIYVNLPPVPPPSARDKSNKVPPPRPAKSSTLQQQHHHQQQQPISPNGYRNPNSPPFPIVLQQHHFSNNDGYVGLALQATPAQQRNHHQQTNNAQHHQQPKSPTNNSNHLVKLSPEKYDQMVGNMNGLLNGAGAAGGSSVAAASVVAKERQIQEHADDIELYVDPCDYASLKEIGLPMQEIKEMSAKLKQEQKDAKKTKYTKENVSTRYIVGIQLKLHRAAKKKKSAFFKNKKGKQTNDHGKQDRKSELKRMKLEKIKKNNNNKNKLEYLSKTKYVVAKIPKNKNKYKNNKKSKQKQTITTKRLNPKNNNNNKNPHVFVKRKKDTFTTKKQQTKQQQLQHNFCIFLKQIHHRHHLLKDEPLTSSSLSAAHSLRAHTHTRTPITSNTYIYFPLNTVNRHSSNSSTKSTHRTFTLFFCCLTCFTSYFVSLIHIRLNIHPSIQTSVHTYIALQPFLQLFIIIFSCCLPLLHSIVYPFIMAKMNNFSTTTETLPKSGHVTEVCKEWLVREDGALAYKLQSQEINDFYKGISHSEEHDKRVAKEIADKLRERVNKSKS